MWLKSQTREGRNCVRLVVESACESFERELKCERGRGEVGSCGGGNADSETGVGVPHVLVVSRD